MLLRRYYGQPVFRPVNLIIVGVSCLMFFIVRPTSVGAQGAGTASGPTCSDATFAPKGDLNNCFKCDENGFFGLKSWHTYLTKKGDCSVDIGITSTTDQPADFSKIWLIALAIFEDILRIAGLVAFGFIVYGGIRYITSQGEPEHTKKAMSTLLNAVIGLVIAIISSSIVAFIGRSLK